MYYSAPDITNAQNILSQKTTNASSPLLPDMTSMPSFGEFNSKLTPLLPENMLNVVGGDIIQAFNETNIKNAINSSIAEILPTIQQDTVSMLKSVVGNFPINPEGTISIDQLGSSATKLAQANQDLAKKTSDQMISVFSNNSQASQLGRLNYSINESLASSSRLSPKGVRDLNDSNLFNIKTSKTVDRASSALGSTSYDMTQNIANNKTFSNSAQTNLQQLSIPQYSGDNTSGFDLYVRRTVYWAYGSGTDIESANLKSSTGRILAEGISAAVDPSVIPYLSRIQFPDIGVRFATDTGGAVKARTASSGTAPIIDVFFEYKEDALAFANSSKPYITVKVYPPASKYKYVANSSPTYGAA